MKTHIMNEENVDRMNNGETYDAGWSVEPRNGCDTIYMKMSESDTYYFYGVCDSYDGCKVAIALMEVCSHENEAACKNDDNGYGCGWCKGVHYSSNDICVPAGNYDGDVGYGIECRDYVNFKSGGDGGNNDDGSGDFPFILVMVMMIVVVTMVIVCGSFYWAKGLQKKIQGRIRGQLSDIRNQQVPVLLGGNPTGVSIGVLPNGEAMTMDTQTQNYLRAQQGLPPLLSTDAQNYINAQEGKPLEMNAQETNFINSQRIQRDQQQRQQQQQQQQQQQPQQQPNKWESSNEDNEPQSASNPNTQQWLPSAGTNTSQYPRSVSQLNHHELMVARARGDVSIPHSGNGEDDDDDGPPMASRPRMARNSLDFDAMSKAKRLDNVMNEGMIGNTSTNNNNDDDHNNNNNNNSGSRRTIVEHTKGSGPTIGGARSSSISEDNDLNANLFSNNNSRIVSSDSVGVEKWGFSRSNKTSKKKNNNNNNDMTTDGDSEDYDTIEMPSKRVITASDRLSTLKKHSRQGVRRIFSADSGPAASPARRRVPHSTRSLSNRSFNFPSPAHSRFKNSSEDPKFAVPSNSRDVSTCPANDCVGGSMTDRPRRMSIEDEFKTASDHWTSISVSSTTSRNSRQRSGTKDMFDNENVGTCSPPPSLSAIGGNSGNHMNLPIQLSNNASPPQNRTLYDPTSPNSPNSINSSNVSSSTPLISPIKPPLLSKSRSRRRLIITQFDNNNNTHSIEPPATTTGVINDHLHNGIINSTKVETSNNSGGSQSVDAARNTLTRNPSFFGNNNENISVITRSLPDHINQQDQHQPSSAMTVMGRQSPFNDPTPNRRSSSYNNGEVVAGPNLMNEFEGAIISPSNANAFPAREPASGKRRLSLLRGSHTPSTRPPLPRNRQFADSPPTGTRNRHGSMDMQFSSDAAREEFNDMEISGSGRYSAIPFQSSSPSPPHNNNHNNNNISLSPSNPQPHHLHGTSNIDFNSNDPSSNPSFDPFQASAGSMHYQQRHPSNINNTATNNNNNNYNNTTNNYTISSTNSTPSTSQSPELTSHSPSTSNSPHNLGSRSRRQRGTFSNMSNNNNSSNTNGTSDNIEDYSINDKFSVRSPPRTNASTPKGTSTKRNRAGVRGRSQTDSAIDVPISISQSSDKNYQSSEELQPYNNPEKALNETVSLLRTTDWKKQCQGLNNSRRLALHHSSVFARQVKDVCSLIVSHCLSLRSVVSKTGILAAQDVIKGMGKRLDSYLDIFCKPLLKKASDASGFLGEEALKALKFMNTSCSWQRVLATMNDICKDTSSTAGPLRANASAVMLHCVSVVGASLSEYRLLDGIVRTCGQLLTDSKEETRRNAKGMCVELVASGAVPLSKLKVLIPPKFYDTVEKLVAKGSGSGGVFGFASGGNSGGGVVPGASIGLDGDRSTPTYRGTPKSAVGTPSSRTRTRSKTDYFAGSASSSNEELQKILLEVNGKDWKDRITAIQNLQSLINTNSASVNTSSILKISESLVTRITDPNVRVSTTALKCAESLISKTSLNAPSVTVLMAALFSSSVSSNTAVSKGSNKSLNSLFLNVNVKDVVVPMVNLILNVRNQKIKPVVLDRIVDVIPTLAMEHSGLMYKHLVPAILKCVLQPKLKREEKRSLAACCLALKQTGPKFISAARARLPDSGFQLLEKMTS
eukprot:TRINITY_DN273_c0_g1_i2.p1 TRINITY_DN273_c0_g1~~TRINITY_DN273_c0_g1_i2.p1  ORF type:complete len:1711 (+),score=489.33 TRINITY_DN273_c0_g1_i2:145-5133(+)